MRTHSVKEEACLSPLRSPCMRLIRPPSFELGDDGSTGFMLTSAELMGWCSLSPPTSIRAFLRQKFSKCCAELLNRREFCFGGFERFAKLASHVQRSPLSPPRLLRKKTVIRACSVRSVDFSRMFCRPGGSKWLNLGNSLYCVDDFSFLCSRCVRLMVVHLLLDRPVSTGSSRA